MNSVKELQELAIKLQSMTSQINQLISQGASQQRAIGLFNEGAQRSGFLPPVVQPQIIQPTIIPQEQPIPIRPIQPIVPSSQPQDPSQIPDNSAEKTLDQIRKEILDKLSPEDKAKAEEELEKQKQEQEQNQPVQPLPPNTCLLYTSPSPRDGLLSRMPSSA